MSAINEVYAKIKEVKSTNNFDELARLLYARNWIAISAHRNKGEEVFVLGRIE